MICPNCQEEVEVLERNYGALFTCPKCQAVYFVNFEGHPEFSNESVEAPMVSFGEMLPDAMPETQIESLTEPSAFGDLAQQISDFGNSEVQITALNYTLEINGLDSKEDMKAFQETITDSRFGWDANDVMKKLRNGHIILEKLNPVQAFVLYKRIYFLDFDLKWTQHVLE